jgi:hypothetical protein
MKSTLVAMAALAIGVGSLKAYDDDEEILAAIERQQEAIEEAIQEQTFQQQLDAQLLRDEVEDAVRRQRDCWYWRNW